MASSTRVFIVDSRNLDCSLHANGVLIEGFCDRFKENVKDLLCHAGFLSLLLNPVSAFITTNQFGSLQIISNKFPGMWIEF